MSEDKKKSVWVDQEFLWKRREVQWVKEKKLGAPLWMADKEEKLSSTEKVSSEVTCLDSIKYFINAPSTFSIRANALVAVTGDDIDN